MEQSTAVTTNQTTTVAAPSSVTRDDVDQFILGSTLAQDLSPAQKELCIKTALSWGLNPLKREIHFVAYQGKEPKIVVGYDVYIKRAERTHNLDGWKAWTEGVGKDLVAKIIIYRKDWSHPFEHEVYYDEAVQKNYKGEVNATWSKMPRFMLNKVAIGQGFRLCFPEEFGGMPYMAEEVGLDEVVSNGYVQREDGQQTNVNTGEIVKRRQVDTTAQTVANVPCGYPDCDGECDARWVAQSVEKYGMPLCLKHGQMARDGQLDLNPKETARTRTAIEEVKATFPGAEDVDPDEVIAGMAKEAS